MRKCAIVSATVLMGLAGHAVGQVAVDGRLSNDEAGLYGLVRWVQNVPTGFGDNAPPQGSCVESDLGDRAGVTTGIEYRIPLADLGSPNGPIKVLAVLANQGHTAFTNQVLPPIPGPGAAALGNTRAVNFAAIAGDQFASVSFSAGDSPIVDGTLDAAYGAPLAVQSTRTSVGDDTDGSNATSTGSELNAIYAVVRGDSLYVMLTGNLKTDFGSKLELFIDNGSGQGFNNFPDGASLPDVDFGALQNMRGNATDPGLTFDAGFSATHYITFGAGNNPVEYFPNLADLTTGVGQFLGCNNAGNGSGILAGCGGSTAIEIALDNANTGGVGATCPPLNGDPDLSNGSEIDNLFAYIDGGRLHIFLGGNLQTSFNKVDLFLDVQDGGQNVLRNDNVDIDFNGLNRMAGLTFDGAFAADYWVGITNGNNPVEMYSNVAVLRTDGPRVDFNNNKLDYGAYSGGPKATNNPIGFGGPRIDIQDGFTANLFTEFAPRLVGDQMANNEIPVGTPGLLLVSINNSNLAGVTSDAADPIAAAAVRTGIELSIDLNEAGWDGVSPIKIAGFVNAGGHDFLSNQVIGGLPAGTANLGDPVGVNFVNIPGDQFVSLDECRADFDGDGFVDFFDFDAYAGCFEDANNCPSGKTADFDGDGFVDFFDFDAYVGAFEAGC